MSGSPWDIFHLPTRLAATLNSVRPTLTSLSSLYPTPRAAISNLLPTARPTNRFHNYLRITRILKWLGEMNLEHLKFGFLVFFAQEAIHLRTIPNVAKVSLFLARLKAVSCPNACAHRARTIPRTRICRCALLKRRLSCRLNLVVAAAQVHAASFSPFLPLLLSPFLSLNPFSHAPPLPPPLSSLRPLLSPLALICRA